MKKYGFSLLLLLFSPLLWAQTSAFMDDLLKSSSLSWGQAAYLVLVSSDNLAEDTTEQRSLDLLKQLKWTGSETKLDEPITLAEYSFLLMKSFGIPGGMWYSLFPGPRYAFRELSFRLILSEGDPDSQFDGTKAIRILGKVMDTYAAKKGES